MVWEPESNFDVEIVQFDTKKPISSAILILVIWYQLSLMLLRSWLPKVKLKRKFLQFATRKRSRVAFILEITNQRRSHCPGTEPENGDSESSSTQFLQLQKNQLIDLRELFERFCNTLPLYGLNSARYVFTFVKSYSLILLVSERGNDPIDIKKTNHIVSFKLGNV